MDKNEKSKQPGNKKTSSRRSGKQLLFFTEEFKRKVLSEISSGKLNKRQAQLIYGIRGNSTILGWIRNSQGLGTKDQNPAAIANFAQMKDDYKSKKLEDENEELRELLRVAELRADLWQKAVEIAEEKFDIDIVKKFGAQALQHLKNKDPRNK